MALLAGTALAQSGAKSPVFPLRDSRQVLLVLTPDWNAVDGSLQRFERSSLTSRWKPVGAAVPVVIGKNGLAWGIGLQMRPSLPAKKEGDLKAPAGVFRLGKAFGRSSDELAGLRMRHLLLGDDLECVDDPHSKYYNQLVTQREVHQPDWTSSEKMWQEKLYKHGVVVEHNTEPARAGAGSCIFLHIWNGPHQGTAGCTAMDEADLIAIMKWLDSARNPVLVQLPKTEYERLKPRWLLP